MVELLLEERKTALVLCSVKADEIRKKVELMGSNDMYWITAIIFAIVLLSILLEEKNKKQFSVQKDNSFSAMLTYLVFFCIQDTVWGLCDSGVIANDTVFFLSSSVFHVSIIFSTYFWLKFVLKHLGDRVKSAKPYMAIEMIVIMTQLTLVTINFFYPVLFSIKEGRYVTEFLRPWSFFNQYFIYFGCGIVALICAIKAEKSKREKMLSVFLFSLTPILMGVFQLLYPNAPFYSIGYFLGCIFIYVYITSRERNEAARGVILNSVADMYYTMHLFNFKEGVMEDFIASDIVNEFISDRSDLQGSINSVMEKTADMEYRDSILEFVNFDTLSERLKDKNVISLDFIGKYHGWTRASFIPIERDKNGKLLSVMYTTQIIDGQKKKEQEMLTVSVTDQLTGLLNRRAYEYFIEEHPEKQQNMVYVSVDVNGLKNVNDGIGHAAGDELLAGAAQCMKQCFGPYGKIYRTGGDEFAIILFASEDELKKIKDDFEEVTANWRGTLVDKVEMSCGYVRASEYSELSMSGIAKKADEEMYHEKARYYQRKGVNRRAGSEAFAAMSSIYKKVLKINPESDSFTVVTMDFSEQTPDSGYSDKLSQWLLCFAENGNVHPDDLKDYLEKTNLEYIKEHFRSNSSPLTISYRRKQDNEFKNASMEIVPAGDYSETNQNLFLFVR